MPRTIDHYGSLKLPKNATKQQIKAKFYELSKKTHPDAPGGSADKFHAINEAYEILGDEAKRRQYDLSLSEPASGPGYTYQPGYNPPSSSYPYSDPFTRRTGPHGAWSTRRPPPRAPPTGFGTYHPFGRHTPHNYGGASSGSYGDPFAAAREQFRQGFADVRSGRSWTNHHHGYPSGSPTGGSPNRRGKGMGGGSRKNAEGGDLGRIIGTFVLVLIVVAFGGTVSTAKAEQPDEKWQQVRRYERERIIRSLGRDDEADGVD
ncbi:hypothetical protein DB88DRAFT_508353 [Papiliotrema laurentii]|uniref:J domain-containing protein n=1 Tax=Papiliotrema laurentii TaxID=5418 RepID=A0AAD9FUA7_PAPLA|nr:hypothetical protein DB88DRAFT_508353 [Papiliotrema laurentii]